MVTILPIDVDEDLVREGVTFAIADRIEQAVRNLNDLLKVMPGEYLDAKEWDAAFARLAALHAETRSALEWAGAFVDPDVSDDPDGGVAL